MMMNASRPTSPWVTNSLPASMGSSTEALATARSSLVDAPANRGTVARWSRYCSRAMAAQLRPGAWRRLCAPCVPLLQLRCGPLGPRPRPAARPQADPPGARSGGSSDRNSREILGPYLSRRNGGAPPIPTDELEDWIRLPADDLDLRVRVEALRRRTDGDNGAAPLLDDDGVLRVGDRWVSLPPVEARLTAALLDRFGAVVSRDTLARSGWPGGSPGRNALDVHVLRLRRRLSPLRLAIRTVRSRGYLLERSDNGGQVAPRAGRQIHANGSLHRMTVG